MADWPGTIGSLSETIIGATKGIACIVQLRSENDGTRSGIDHVVACARRVIDGLTATPRGTAFQCTELCSEAGVVQQFDAPAVEQGQQS